MEILVPQIQERSFEVIKVIPQERVSMRIAEQTVDLRGPHIMEEIVAVARLVLLVQKVVREILDEIKDIHQERLLTES